MKSAVVIIVLVVAASFAGVFGHYWISKRLASKKKKPRRDLEIVESAGMPQLSREKQINETGYTLDNLSIRPPPPVYSQDLPPKYSTE